MLGHVNARTRSRVKGNRLIEMEPDNDPNDLTDSDKKHVHAYNYMGRRVRTRVYTWDTEQGQWETTPDEDRRFLYHGRQRILTLSGSGADDELFKFVWGPGPGSAGVSPVGRAGALNHLLAIGDDSDPNQLDYVCFSDGALDTRRGPQAPLAARATPPGGVPRVKGGPGNLGQIANRSDGTLVAKYDYNGRTRAGVGECEDCCRARGIGPQTAEGHEKGSKRPFGPREVPPDFWF